MGTGNGEWRATRVPPGNPWGVKKDASRIVFRPGHGHLGPYVHPGQKGGTWLQLAAGTNSDPTGEARIDAIHALAATYGLSPPATRTRRVTEYPFSTLEGIEVRQLRYDYADGDKSFAWQRHSGGRWASGLDGMSPKLYREDDIQEAIARGEIVDIFEGCKTADAGRRLGLVATTSPHGKRLADHHLEAFRGAHLVRLHPDAALDGRDYVLEAGLELARVVKEVRVIELYPYREDGSDLADWVQERTVDRDEARILFSHLAQHFDQWADEYLRRRPLVGLADDLEEVVRRPEGRNAIVGFSKEIRRVAEARGVQPGPFVGWADQRIHEGSLSIKIEILESAVAFAQVEGGDDFATEALRQFMMAADPCRWRLFDDKGEVTVQRVGQVLTRIGVKQRAVFVDGHTLRLRRFSEVHRAAEQRGVHVDSLRPCDPEKERESQDLATLAPGMCQ